MTRRKSTPPIFIIILVVLLLGAGGYVAVKDQQAATQPVANEAADAEADTAAPKTAPTAQPLSSSELRKLPPVAQDISASFFTVQNIRKNKPAHGLFPSAHAAEAEFVRGVIYERGPRPREIYWYELVSQEKRRVTNDSYDDFSPTINSEGLVAYFSNTQDPMLQGNSTQLPIETRLTDFLGRGGRKILDVGGAWTPYFSPSGNRIAVVNVRRGAIVVYDIEGMSSKEYNVASQLGGGGAIGAIVWSSDETRLLFQVILDMAANMGVGELDLSSGKPSVSADTPAYEVLPQYLDTGEVSYLTGQRSGEAISFKAFEIKNINQGTTRTFSLGEGVRHSSYLWSPDYSTVYFVTNSGDLSWLNVASGEYVVATRDDGFTFDGIAGWGPFPDVLLMYKEAPNPTWPCQDVYLSYVGATPVVKLFSTCP